MVFSNTTKHNFSSGELSPKLRGRSDSETYFSGVERMENFIPDTFGQATFRPGTVRLHEIDTTKTPALVRDLSLDDDEKMFILNIGGESVKLTFYRSSTGISLNVKSTVYGDATVNLADSSAYVLRDLDCVQMDDYMVVTTPGYAVFYKLYAAIIFSIEFGTTYEWRCAKYTGITYNNSPLAGFPLDLAPTAVSKFEERLVIISGGILYFGRSPNPDTGAPRYLSMAGKTVTVSGQSDGKYRPVDNWGGPLSSYDDWHCPVDTTTIGNTGFKVYIAGAEVPEYNATPTPTTYRYTYQESSTQYILVERYSLGSWAAFNGEVTFKRNVGYADDGFEVTLRTIAEGETILWAAPIKDFLAVGSTSGVYAISSSDGAGLSPTNIKVSVLSYVGSANVRPVRYKDGFIYVENTYTNFQYIKYDFLNGGYKAVSLNPAQRGIIYNKIQGIAFLSGDIDRIFVVDEDYALFSFTISEAGISSGFYRLPTVAADGVSGVFSFYDIAAGANVLYVIYQTVDTLFVSSQNEVPRLLDREDFYTGVQAMDVAAYDAYLYGVLKDGIYLDLCQTFTDTDSVTLPATFEGLTVDIVADGMYYGTEVVPATPYTITLDATYDVVHVGFKYKGLIKSLALTGSSTNGEAGAREKNIAEVAILFLNTLGAKFGFDPYNFQDVIFAEAGNLLAGQPPTMFTGVKRVVSQDNWEINKHWYIVQDDPFPCTIQRIDAFGETANE